MLKKIFIGILCFVILAATGLGIYLYTLDWNKHKTVVAQRFSQISGLKADIDGNLRVELFPSPKFTASKVKFYKQSDLRNPLVEINEISALVELLPLKDNRFILSSMNMVRPTVYVRVDENGVSNWKNVGQNSANKSGNVEVSFSDIRLSNAVIDYNNLKNKQKNSFEGISANISAPALTGPYKTSGSFIHNKSEIKFKGNIVKEKDLKLNMEFNSISSNSKLNIEGTIGEKSQGLVSFDTKSLFDIATIAFGENALHDYYDEPVYISFKYDVDDVFKKLNNLTAKYGNHTTGTGNVTIKKSDDIKNITMDFNMADFDFTLLNNIARDIIHYSKSEHKENLSKYEISANLKSGKVQFNGAAAQNLSLNASYKNGIIDINRLGLSLPGNTNVKTVGKVNINEAMEYKFNQTLHSDDLRTFASIFNIDLTKLTAKENQKTVFKNADLKTMVTGNLDKLKISIPKAVIDNTTLNGNIGILTQEDGQLYVLTALNASKTILDQYIEVVPENMKKASFKDKFLYQVNRFPWKNKISLEVDLNLASTVYGEIPMEHIALQFKSDKDVLEVKKLSVGSMGGAKVDCSFTATDIYDHPQFEKLSYDVKTSNFPFFAQSLGIETGKKDIFKRKIFASKGILSGSLNKFNLNSIQKFGDTEFSYAGDVADDFVNGALELKTNNFTKFVKGLGLNYTPDIPVTTFALSGQLSGTPQKFKLDNTNAFLGANKISGDIKFSNSGSKPSVTAELTFDKFDADRWFNLPKKLIETEVKEDDIFISKPNIKETKIDYAALDKVNMDLKLNTKSMVLYGKNYTDIKSDIKLRNKKLEVTNLSANLEDSNIKLKFNLDSNDFPRIDGFFEIDKLQSPKLGGKLYVLESGLLSAEGSFNSMAGSQKEFIDNLSAKGKFNLQNTAMNGWDFDIIKFELEQSKSVQGFEERITDCLKSGRSNFSKIRGSFDINKGLLVAENIIWESPVVNMNMNTSLNLSTWILNANFSAFYHNASFSDVIKFNYSGDLARPIVKADLEESIKRIGHIEEKINTVKETAQKKRLEQISGKLAALNRALDAALQDINRLTLDVARFTPLTQNKDVLSIYEANLQDIRKADNNIRTMKDSLKNNPSDETLMNIEADLGAIKAKLKFIPKALEENFIVDAKYIFDDTFNKIAWVFNVAQNNSGYHKSLTDVYMSQVDLLETSGTPLTEEQLSNLKKGMDKIKDTTKSITTLHNEVRDSYLGVIDVTKISDMNRHNNLAKKSLNKILSDTLRLNEEIIANIDMFRAVLGISSRDYDQYLVYPPEVAEAIDIRKPTIKNPAMAKKTEKTEKKEESTKKADELKAEKTKAETPAEKVENVKVKDKNVLNETEKKNSETKDDELKKKESLNLADFSTESGLASLLKKLTPNQKVENKKAVKQDHIVSREATVDTQKAEELLSEVVKVAALSDVLPIKNKVPAENKTQVTKADIESLSLTQNVVSAKSKESFFDKTKKAFVEFLTFSKAPDKEVKVTKKAEHKAEVKEVKLATKTEPKAEVKEVKVATKTEPKAEVKEVKVAMKTEPKVEVKEVKVATKTEPKAEVKIADNQSLLDKTKNVIADLFSGSEKETEEEVKIARTDLSKAKIENNKKAESHAEINKIILAEKTEPVAKKDSTKDMAMPKELANPQNLNLPKVKEVKSLRINPVVAMNIGKNNVPVTVAPKEIHVNAGFGSKKKEVNISAPTNKEKHEPSLSDTPVIVADAEINEIEEFEFMPEEDSKVVAIKVPETETKFDLINLFAETKNINIEPILKNDLTQEALLYAKETDRVKSSKQAYLFSRNSNVKFSGVLGKSMFANDNTEVKTAKSGNKYVFARNGASPHLLSGNIQKTASAAVK